MKQIKGFENYYITENGEVFSNKSNKWLSPIYDTDGYRQLSLCKNGKVYTKRMHRMVCETFIPNIENKKCINHINGIKTDNMVENLEWCTHSENNKHAFKFGLKKIDDAQKLRIAYQGKKKAKIVLNLENGIYYNSLTEAANLLGYNYKYLSARLLNTIKNNTNLQYV